jgi:hypothetical protein
VQALGGNGFVVTGDLKQSEFFAMAEVLAEFTLYQRNGYFHNGYSFKRFG